MRFALMSAVALLTIVPTAVAGDTMLAEGPATYTYSDSTFTCTSAGEFAWAYDDQVGGVLSGVVDDSCLFFFPDAYAPGECAHTSIGFECAYPGSYFVLRPDGSFSYVFTFTAGGVDRVDGTLVRYL